MTKSMEYFVMTHQWMDMEKNSLEDVVLGIEDLKTVQARREKECASNPDGAREKSGNRKSKPLVIGAMEKTENSSLLQVNISVGDTITLGNYNGEDIYWRVLKISEDGTEAVVVARDVLTVKAFDAAESGRYNHDGETNYYFEEGKIKEDYELQAYVKGNSSWETSNIRTWLNSALENVQYEGQAPIAKAMADGCNGYQGEKGFLCSFTEEELSLIKDTKVQTKGNILSDKEIIETYDKVFLLSMEELEWFVEANVSLLAKPTEGAIAHNQTTWYQDYCLGYGVENMNWWLREPVLESGCQCYLVGNGYYEENILAWEVGVESFGIRPAMTIDLTK